MQDATQASSAIGSVLRAARLEQRKTVVDIAQALRIREDFLNAIEDNRFDQLPGPAYAIGFIRGYADHLGLDSAEIIRRFKAQRLTEINSAAESVFLPPVSEGRLSGGTLLLAGLIFAALAYGGWYAWSSKDPVIVDDMAPPPVIEPLENTQQPEAAPVAEAPAVAPVTESSSVAPSSASEAMPITAPTEKSASAPAPISDATPPVHSAPVSAPVVAEPVPQAQPQPPASSRLALRISSDSWVQIKAKSGEIVLARLLRAGESYQLPNRDDLLLTVGNAAGVQIEIDGVAQPPLGASGMVRKNIALDPQAFKASAGQ